MARMSKSKEKNAEPSYETGRFTFCPASNQRHQGWVAVRIIRAKGQGAAWFYCTCRSRAYMPQDWKDGEGYSQEDLQRLSAFLGPISIT